MFTFTCYSTTATVRLSGGHTPHEGRVELFYNQEWGTICDNGWGITDAEVVCRALDFPGAASAQGGAKFGEGTGTIHFDQVQCEGDELSLVKCTRGADGSSCSHSQDASLTCQPLCK